jgi:hypothetical protein
MYHFSGDQSTDIPRPTEFELFTENFRLRAPRVAGYSYRGSPNVFPCWREVYSDTCEASNLTSLSSRGHNRLR